MPARKVVVTDRQAEMIDRLVQSGRYRNASEVLREGLRLLQQRDAEDEARLIALREAARVGIEDIEAGRYTTLETPDEIRQHVARLTSREFRGDGTGG